MQPFWQAFGLALKAAEPAARAAVSVQLAAVGFVGNRARAQLELASRLAGCRTIQDVASAQTAFWQEAAHEYAALARQTATTWSTALTNGVDSLQSQAVVRDLLTLPEQPRPRQEPATAPGTRRAA
jgi:hypothetical protein